jgi:Ca2+-binding RTX toxin-like protein
VGTGWNDTLAGTPGDDVIGNDTIDGGSGNDTICGGSGNDDLRGSLGDDAFEGGAGDDSIAGQEGTDTVSYSKSPGPVGVDLAGGSATGDGTDSLAGLENAVGSAFGDLLQAELTGSVLAHWGRERAGLALRRLADGRLRPQRPR